MIGKVNAGGSKSPYPSASELTITYTGDKTERDIYDTDGNRYKLLELTSSGILTIDKKVPMEACIVGGGGCGYQAYKDNKCSGGGGAGGYMYNAKLWAQTLTVIVGAIQGRSSVTTEDNITREANGGGGSSDGTTTGYYAVGASGGTGGGNGKGYVTSQVGAGDGLSKKPFGDNSVYSYPICAGGAGGGIYYLSGSNPKIGYDGASNGASATTSTDTGTGGERGGGNGGNYDNSHGDGYDATAYGSGGGGGALLYKSDGTTVKTAYNGGLGYQGVVFIRIRY